MRVVPARPGIGEAAADTRPGQQPFDLNLNRFDARPVDPRKGAVELVEPGVELHAAETLEGRLEEVGVLFGQGNRVLDGRALAVRCRYQVVREALYLASSKSAARIRTSPTSTPVVL